MTTTAAAAAFAPSDDQDVDDTMLCGWVKFEMEKEDGSDNDSSDSSIGEWFVYGYPEQGAGEHQTVLVRAKSSGRITRVKLGIQIAYNTYEVAENLGVIYDKSKPSSPLYVDGVVADQDESTDRKRNSNISYAPTYSTTMFTWRPINGIWFVRGPPGCTGQAVTVTSKRTGRRTQVFLTNEAGDSNENVLYGFARC